VLRGPGAIPAAKRTQEACEPRDRASKGASRSRRRILSGRQHRLPCSGLGLTVRRGRRAGRVRKGCPGTWEASLLSGGSSRLGRRVRNGPGPRSSRSRQWERSRGAATGTLERRQRSEGGRRARSRSVLIVPMKSGNLPQGTRWMGGGTPVWRNFWRER